MDFMNSNMGRIVIVIDRLSHVVIFDRTVEPNIDRAVQPNLIPYVGPASPAFGSLMVQTGHRVDFQHLDLPLPPSI
jgi:hypothetical protein